MHVDHPRPTQPAFKPATREQLRGMLLLGVFCLITSVLGSAMWIYGPNAIGANGWRVNQLVVLTPLVLIATLYIFYKAWRDWRRSRYFFRHKQRIEGVITHLWQDKDDDGRNAYYVGYRYGDDYHVYQRVKKRRFNALASGQRVRVHFLPDDPQTSYFEPVKHKRKRKKEQAASS